MFDMGKISLDFNFLNENGDVISTVTFQSIEDIDQCIEKLQEARTEFEHRIEMKRQKSREKRKRKKDKHRLEPEDTMSKMEEEYQKLIDSYNQLPDCLKEMFKTVTDSVTDLVESVRKGRNL